MARVLHSIEKGIRIVGENSVTGVDILFGAGAPGGDTGEQDAAAVGSIYMRTNGQFYTKIADNDVAADWEVKGNLELTNMRWRNEIFRAATNDTLAAGNTDPSTWTDNDSAIDDTDFTVGDYVLGDANGTPAIFRVSAISTPNITLAAAADPLADGDKFVVRHYLPDSGADQENAALLIYGGTAIIKVADVDWEIAKAIYLSSGYTPANGDPAAGDSVEVALQKIDANQDDIQAASGLTQGDVNYGTFTGDLLADSQTSKQLFQRIETLLNELKGVQASGITTEASVDEVPVASCKAVKWLVDAFETATPANRQGFEVFALTDGSTGYDDTVYAKLKVGANFNLTIKVDVSGGNLRLRAASTTAGVTVNARRIQVIKDTL